MNKKIIFAAVILVTVLFTIVKYTVNGNGALVSPEVRKIFSWSTTASLSTLPPQVSSNNPPKEIQYSSATDLKQELETVNPQVLDKDFE